MTIKTKLSQRDYINASFVIITGRPFTRYILYFICAISFINFALSFNQGKASIASVLPVIIIFSIYIAVIYFGFKRSYSSNKRASENIEYSFEQNNLVLVGESFKSELSWNKIYKVTQTKNWLLIWQNRQIA